MGRCTVSRRVRWRALAAWLLSLSRASSVLSSTLESDTSHTFEHARAYIRTASRWQSSVSHAVRQRRKERFSCEGGWAAMCAHEEGTRGQLIAAARAPDHAARRTGCLPLPLSLVSASSRRRSSVATMISLAEYSATISARMTSRRACRCCESRRARKRSAGGSSSAMAGGLEAATSKPHTIGAARKGRGAPNTPRNAAGEESEETGEKGEEEMRAEAEAAAAAAAAEADELLLLLPPPPLALLLICDDWPRPNSGPMADGFDALGGGECRGAALPAGANDDDCREYEDEDAAGEVSVGGSGGGGIIIAKDDDDALAGFGLGGGWWWPDMRGEA